MCDMKLDFAVMSASLGIDFASHFESELRAIAALEADGLVRPSGNGFDVTDLGRLLIRNVAMCFDEYLGSKAEASSGMVYSRTI